MPSWVVDDERAGMRLDVFVVRTIDGLSRRRAEHLIAQQHILLNGASAQKGARVQAGDVIFAAHTPAPDFAPAPATGADLEVLFEDSRLVLLARPPNVPCLPSGPKDTRSVASFLAARYPESVGVGVEQRRAGLLFELDDGVSGVLLAARTAQTYQTLRNWLYDQGTSFSFTFTLLLNAPAAADALLESPDLGVDSADVHGTCALVRCGPRYGGGSSWLRAPVLPRFQAALTSGASIQSVEGRPAVHLEMLAVGGLRLAARARWPLPPDMARAWNQRGSKVRVTK